MKTRHLLAAALLLLPLCLAAAPRHFELRSPDGRLCVGVDASPTLQYTLSYDGQALVSPSELAVALGDGSAYDASVRFEKALRASVDETVPAPVYKRARVRDLWAGADLGTFDGSFSRVLKCHASGLYRVTPVD